MNKLVSAVIITYNRLELFKQAFESVKKQTYQNIEIVVVDGSDNNETETYVTNKKNVIYFKSDSHHPNRLRNTGVECSNGELIAFLDDDDTWSASKIQEQIHVFDNQTSDLVYTGKNIVGLNNNIIKYSYQKPFSSSLIRSIMLDNFIGTTSSIMIIKQILIDINCFDEILPALQDYDLYIRVCAKYKVIGIDKPLTNYYAGHSSTQISEDEQKFDAAAKIIKTKYKYLPNSFLLTLGLWFQKTKRKIKKYMNKNILTFDKWAIAGRDAGMEKGHNASVKHMLKMIFDKYEKNEKKYSVMDVGCGNGWVVRKFKKHPLCLDAHGLDGANNMIKKAKVKDFEGTYLNQNLEFWNPSQTYDIVFSMETLYYFKEPKLIIENIYHNALNPNGFFIIGIDHYKENIESLNWGKEFNLDITTLSINEWKNHLIRVGFTDVQTKQVEQHKNWQGTLIISGLKPSL